MTSTEGLYGSTMTRELLKIFDVDAKIERDVAVSLGASILGSSRAMQPRLTKLIQDGWVEVSVEPIWSPTGTTTTWLRRFSS